MLNELSSAFGAAQIQLNESCQCRSQEGQEGRGTQGHAVSDGMGLMGSPPPALADDSPLRARTNPSLPRTETSTSTKPMGEMLPTTRALLCFSPHPQAPGISLSPSPHLSFQLTLFLKSCSYTAARAGGGSTLMFFFYLIFLAYPPP